MTRDELINKLADAVARYEGYYLTREQAQRMGVPWPTRAQRQANPGNVRRWRAADGAEYPRSGGYVDFVAWAKRRLPGARSEEIRAAAEAEGWRVLRKLLSDYIRGHYTANRPPNLRELIVRYAPAADGNAPERYVAFVAQRTGIDPSTPLVELIRHES